MPVEWHSERHCCIEPHRQVGAARSSPEPSQGAADRVHWAPTLLKLGGLRPDARIAQEDLPSRETLNAQCNSARQRCCREWPQKPHLSRLGPPGAVEVILGKGLPFTAPDRGPRPRGPSTGSEHCPAGLPRWLNATVPPQAARTAGLDGTPRCPQRVWRRLVLYLGVALYRTAVGPSPWPRRSPGVARP